MFATPTKAFLRVTKLSNIVPFCIRFLHFLMQLLKTTLIADHPDYTGSYVKPHFHIRSGQ